MENKTEIDAFIQMVNENNRKQREKEEKKVEETPSLLSRFQKRGTGTKLIALAVVATMVAGASAGIVHAKNVNSYDPSNYTETHDQIVEAISTPDTTTIEFLQEQGYHLSAQDEKYLKNTTIVNYLNKIHDTEGPDYEQVKNQYGDIVQLNLDTIKEYLKEKVNLSKDTEIHISYQKNKSLDEDELRITYYNNQDEGILLVSKDIKSIIERVVEAQNFAMEHGENAVGNTTVLNNSIAGILELDDSEKPMQVVRAVDAEFKAHHK